MVLPASHSSMRLPCPVWHENTVLVFGAQLARVSNETPPSSMATMATTAMMSLRMIVLSEVLATTVAFNKAVSCLPACNPI